MVSLFGGMARLRRGRTGDQIGPQQRLAAARLADRRWGGNCEGVPVRHGRARRRAAGLVVYRPWRRAGRARLRLPETAPATGGSGGAERGADMSGMATGGAAEGCRLKL